MLLAPFLRDEPLDGARLNLFACKPDRALRLAADGLLAQPRDAAVADPAKTAWANYLEDAPYARELAGIWPSRAGLFSPSGLKVLLEGLALYAQSRDAKLDGTLRFALLQRAADRVSEAARQKDTLPRRLTAGGGRAHYGRAGKPVPGTLPLPITALRAQGDGCAGP
jgi:hypothetical protein